MKEFLEISKIAFSEVVEQWLFYSEKLDNNPDDERLKEIVKSFNSIRIKLGNEIARMESDC